MVIRNLLVGASLLISSASVNAETLGQAIAEAYQSNPTIARERYRLRQTDETYVQAQASLRPTLSAQLTGGYTRDDYYGQPAFLAVDKGRSAGAKLNLTQPLYLGGKATAEIAAAAAGIRAGRASLRSAEQDTVFGVIQSYADVVRDRQSLDIRRTHLQALTYERAEVRARQAAGEDTITDVHQAEAQLDSAVTLVAEAENQMRASEMEYVDLVGRIPDDLDDPPALPGVPASSVEAFRIAADKSPELASARYVEEQSRSEIAAARAAKRPTISLAGSASWNDPIARASGRDPNRGLAAQIVIDQPLFSGGGTSSAIRQAIDHNGADRISIEIARRTLVQDVANAWNMMVSASRSISSEEAEVEAATETLKGMKVEYRVGQRSIYDVLVAEQVLRDARLSLVAAQHDRLVATAAVLRHIGGLEAEALVQGLGRYDPAAHFRDVVHRQSVPWDVIPRTLDAIAHPSSKGEPLVGPPASEDTASLFNSSSEQPADPAFAADVPLAPVPGTLAPR